MKKTSGITLIALVITIIILLILAGIAIVQISEKGIFSKAEQAKEKFEYESAKEIIKLKLTEIQMECIEKQEEYNIVKIAKSMKDSDNITIEKYYNSNSALIKTGVTENIVNLTAIVVSVNEYSKYKFLIGEKCEIIGVLTEEVDENTEIEDFKTMDKFESEILGEKISNIKLSPILEQLLNKGNIKTELGDILTSSTVMEKIIQSDEAVSYILNDKECLDIIINNEESIKILAKYQNLSEETIKNINVDVKKDSNKANNILNKAGIEEVSLDDAINSTTLFNKILNSNNAVDFMVGTNNEIIDYILNSKVAVEKVNTSNYAIAKIVNNEEILKKYNESSVTNIKLSKFTGNYTEDIQVFVADVAGNYRIQCWGARGRCKSCWWWIIYIRNTEMEDMLQEK